MNHDHDQSVTEAEQGCWEREILGGLSVLNAHMVAMAYGTTVEEVRRICGSDGHQWEEYDNESPLGVVSWCACVRCGAPDDDDGEP